jgi:hypothetical protein
LYFTTIEVIIVEPEASWNFVDSFNFVRGLECGEEVWAACVVVVWSKGLQFIPYLGISYNFWYQ